MDEPIKSAFNILKEALIEAPILQLPNWSLPFEIYCDASEFSVGAVLGQRKEHKHVANFYASKTLNGPQLHLFVTEKELLAIIFALENFRSYVLGSKIIVYSDHSTLKFLLKKKKRSLD